MRSRDGQDRTGGNVINVPDGEQGRDFTAFEVFEFRGATIRLEWYPRMDVLVEVEGTEEAIDAAMAATGIERNAFTAESLTAFVERYAARGLQPAVALSELGGGPPSWDPLS